MFNIYFSDGVCLSEIQIVPKHIEDDDKSYGIIDRALGNKVRLKMPLQRNRSMKISSESEQLIVKVLVEPRDKRLIRGGNGCERVNSLPSEYNTRLFDKNPIEKRASFLSLYGFLGIDPGPIISLNRCSAT